MGPSGAGKSRVGAALAAELGAPFLEGDDFHPPGNIATMRGGAPLTDADRAGWVEAIMAAVGEGSAPLTVLACSALTPFVQARLRSGATHAPVFLLLDAPRAVLAGRLAARTDHFMPPALLDSQLAALRPPPDAVRLDASQPVEAVVAAALDALRQQTQQQNPGKADQPDQR